MQTDPIGTEDDLNLYAYAHTDPVNGSDPFGEWCILEIGTTCTQDPPTEEDIDLPQGGSRLDGLQTALDAAGFAGPVGPFADSANALVSAFRGNWTDAGINLVAMVPIFGDGVKGAKMASNAFGDLVQTAQRQYPGKAGKIENHHIEPLYIGGAKSGRTAPLDLSGILCARHIMRGNEDGYAKQETNGGGSGSGPRAAA